jgi:ADP-heptose:LPS heptosyltransferase
MEFFARGSAVISFLSGAKRRVGFHPFYNAGPYRGDLMTHRLLYNPHLHTSQTFRVMVEALACDPAQLPRMEVRSVDDEIIPPPFMPRPEEVRRVEELLRSKVPACSPLVLLNPNGSDLLPLRRWPTDRYVEVAKRLLSQVPDAGVIFTGAPNEMELAEQLVCQVGSPRCISLAGKTTLRELLVLFSLADVLITNDSGPAHFATLTPIRVVTLFGPETPALYNARSPRNVPLWAGLVCSPCINAFNNRQSPCRNNLCMQSISVEQVLARVLIALKETGQRSNSPVPARLTNLP